MFLGLFFSLLTWQGTHFSLSETVLPLVGWHLCQPWPLWSSDGPEDFPVGLWWMTSYEADCQAQDRKNHCVICVFKEEDKVFGVFLQKSTTNVFFFSDRRPRLLALTEICYHEFDVAVCHRCVHWNYTYILSLVKRLCWTLIALWKPFNLKGFWWKEKLPNLVQKTRLLL